MTKRLLLFGLTVTLLFNLVSCSVEKGDPVRDTATAFLTAYWSMEWQEACSYCTDACAEWIVSMTDTSDIPEPVWQEMKKASEETSFEIVSIEIGESGNQAQVVYSLTAPGLLRPLEKRLLLKVEGAAALVDTVE